VSATRLDEPGATPTRRPGNGLFLATALAAAFAAVVLAFLVVLAEASTGVASTLTIIERVGPLSGKVIWTLVAFAVAWLVLAVAFRNREVNWRVPLLVVGVLLVIAFVFTFPPVFQAFAPD
jgi:cell division protein FtsW (lipid II flippase)